MSDYLISITDDYNDPELLLPDADKSVVKEVPSNYLE